MLVRLVRWAGRQSLLSEMPHAAARLFGAGDGMTSKDSLGYRAAEMRLAPFRVATDHS